MTFKGNKGIVKYILQLKYIFPLISFVYAYKFIKTYVAFPSRVCFGTYFDSFFQYRNVKNANVPDAIY